jgi:hypothetical protein
VRRNTTARVVKITVFANSVIQKRKAHLYLPASVRLRRHRCPQAHLVPVSAFAESTRAGACSHASAGKEVIFQHPQRNLYYSVKHKPVAHGAALLTQTPLETRRPKSLTGQSSIKLLTKCRKLLILVSLEPYLAKRTPAAPSGDGSRWGLQNGNRCGCGGIGRRAGFRCLCPLGTWRFDSSHPHWTGISYRACKRRIIQPLSRWTARAEVRILRNRGRTCLPANRDISTDIFGAINRRGVPCLECLHLEYAYIIIVHLNAWMC